MLTNSSGAVTDIYAYDVFGNLIDATGSTPNPYLYRGERYDADLGLYYLRARWYNPVTGRFMTRDPYSGSIYDPQSLHRYNYARSNPANYIDPSGRAAVEDFLNPNRLAKTAAVTSLGYIVACGYYALASSEHLVGQEMGQDITELKLLFSQCAARITATDYLTSFLVNFGLGFAQAEIGWALGDGEQGAIGLAGDEFGGARLFAGEEPTPSQHGFSARDVNPLGGETNCVNCALAMDNTLAGRPTVALDSIPQPLGSLGTNWVPVYGQQQIETALQEAGPGARGIVFGESPIPGEPGHVWNVVNQNGNINFIDAQAGGGGGGNFQKFVKFWFLRTN